MSDYRLKLLDLVPADDPEIQAADLSLYNEAWVSAFQGADAVVHLVGVPAQDRSSWGALTRANIDALANVFAAAARHGVKRVVFASSVWVMASRRFGTGEISAAPEGDPGDDRYGATKLFGERLAKSFAHAFGISTVALRVGACRDGDNAPSSHVPLPDWNRGCWLSDRDFCAGVERAVTTEMTGFTVVNLVSDNPGSRWTLGEGARDIGFHPQDGAPTRAGARGPRMRLAQFAQETLPRLIRRLIPADW